MAEHLNGTCHKYMGIYFRLSPASPIRRCKSDLTTCGRLVQFFAQEWDASKLQAIGVLVCLLEDERNGPLLTRNDEFAQNLSTARTQRIFSRLRALGFQDGVSNTINFQQLASLVHLSNEDFTIYDVHDTLKAYYDVAVKRFIDSGLDWGSLVTSARGTTRWPVYVVRAGRAGADRAAGHPGLVQPGGIQPGRADRGEGHRADVREGRRLAGLEPAGLSGSFFDRDDIMTRRFAVGHNRGEDGTLSVGRLWRRSRGDNPGGGIASSAADMLRWARFHLGSGVPGVLPAEALRQMREPTTALRGSSLGDGIGIGWFLREVDGVRAAGHGGSANGQFADLLLVPERGFAVVALCNEGPDGIPFNQAVIRWALQEYLGLTDRDPEPLPFDEARAREVAGRYENEVMTFTVGIAGDGAADGPADGGPDQAGDPGGGGQGTAARPRAVRRRPAPPRRVHRHRRRVRGPARLLYPDTSGAVTGVDLAGRLATRVEQG